jgi:hypothetical protein
VALEICFIIGLLYVLGLELALIETIGNSGWREVLILANIPALFAYILQLLLIDESPRYLASQGQHAAALVCLNAMAVCNGEAELSPIECSAGEEFRPLALFPGLGKVGMLFEKKWRRVTAQLMLLWTVTIFAYHWLIFIVPDTLMDSSSQAGYFLLLLMSLVQLPAIAVSMYGIEHPKTGRKYTLTLAFAAQTVCFGTATLVSNPVAMWAALVSAMFFMNMPFDILIHTQVRCTTRASGL